MAINSVRPSVFSKATVWAIKPLLRIAPRPINKIADIIGSAMTTSLISRRIENLLGRPYDLGAARRLCLHIASKNGGKVVIIGQGKRKIVFASIERIDNKIDKLTQIYNLVVELNAVIPARPVQKVYIKKTKKVWGKYFAGIHGIGVSLNSHLLGTTAHEMGHAIFRILLGGELGSNDEVRAVRDPLWREISWIAATAGSYKIVKDSNYEKGTSNRNGHPSDDDSELFASSLMIYRLYPDEFIKNIFNPATEKNASKLGRIIFIYLRDRIFRGNLFSKSDPFKCESIDRIQIINDPVKRESLAWIKGKTGDKSDVPFLENFLNDPDTRVREQAYNSIREIKKREAAESPPDNTELHYTDLITVVESVGGKKHYKSFPLSTLFKD